MQTQKTPFTAEISETNEHEHRKHLICCGGRKVNCCRNLSLLLFGSLLKAKLFLLVMLMHGDEDNNMLNGKLNYKMCLSECNSLIQNCYNTEFNLVN